MHEQNGNIIKETEMDKSQTKEETKILLEGLSRDVTRQKIESVNLKAGLKKLLRQKNIKKKPKKGGDPGGFTDKRNNICIVDCGSQKVKEKRGRIPV